MVRGSAAAPKTRRTAHPRPRPGHAEDPALVWVGGGGMVATVPTAIHVEVLPARLGDCLLVECRRPTGPTWRMLVDGGPPDTWPLLEARLRRLDPADRHIDVAVITHIDNDHIGGMLAFLSSDLAADVGDFWFNGRTHLSADASGKTRSIEQGESLVTALLGPLGPPSGKAGAKLP